MTAIRNDSARHASYAFLGSLVLTELRRARARAAGAHVRPGGADEQLQLRRMQRLLATAAAGGRLYGADLGLADQEYDPGLREGIDAYDLVSQLLPEDSALAVFVPVAHRVLGELEAGWEAVSDKAFAEGELEAFLVRMTHAGELAPRAGCLL